MALILNKKTKAEDVGSNSKGDIVVNNGTTITSLPVGTDTQILEADSATSTGLKWSPKPAGTLATTAKGDLITHNGTTSNLLTVGSNNYVLTADSTTLNGIAWKPAAGGGGSSSETVGSLTPSTGTTATALVLTNTVSLWQATDPGASSTNNTVYFIQGIVAEADGTRRTIVNASSHPRSAIQIYNNHASAGANDKIFINTTNVLILTRNESATFVYSTLLNGWILVHTNGTLSSIFLNTHNSFCPWYKPGSLSSTAYIASSVYYYPFYINKVFTTTQIRFSAGNSTVGPNLYVSFYRAGNLGAASPRIGDLIGRYDYNSGWNTGTTTAISPNTVYEGGTYPPGHYWVAFSFQANFTAASPTASTNYLMNEMLFEAGYNTTFYGYVDAGVGSPSFTGNVSINSTRTTLPPITIFV